MSAFITIPSIFFLPYFNFQLATKPGYPESLQQLVEMIKNPASLSISNAGKEDKARQSRENKVIGDTWFSCTVV